MNQCKWEGHFSETKYHRSAIELTATQTEISERRETDAKMEEKEKRKTERKECGNCNRRRRRWWSKRKCDLFLIYSALKSIFGCVEHWAFAVRLARTVTQKPFQMEEDVANVRLVGNNYRIFSVRLTEKIPNSNICMHICAVRNLTLKFMIHFFWARKNWINPFEFEHLIGAIPLHAMDGVFRLIFRFAHRDSCSNGIYGADWLSEHWSWPFDFPSEHNVINHVVCAPSKQWPALKFFYRVSVCGNAESPLWIVGHHL